MYYELIVTLSQIISTTANQLRTALAQHYFGARCRDFLRYFHITFHHTTTTLRRWAFPLRVLKQIMKIKQPRKNLKPIKSMKSACIAKSYIRYQLMGGFSVNSVENGLIVFVLGLEKKIMRLYLAVNFVPKVIFNFNF